MKLISIIMPAYNAEKYIKEAINSVIYQTYSHFELIIINDGSTDKTLDIINSFQDKRIVLLNNETNKGLIYSLNKGLKHIKGEFIARMDSDDICLSNRLEEQLRFMEKHNYLAACGSWYRLIPSGQLILVPEHHESLKVFFLEYTPIAHPTAFIRTSFLKVNNIEYRQTYPHSEDFNLWFEIIEKSGKLGNVQKKLLEYRVHLNQVSQNYNDKQFENSVDIRYNYLINKFKFNEVDKNTFSYIYNSKFIPSNAATLLYNLIKHLFITNDKYYFLQQQDFNKLLNKWLLNIAHRTNCRVTLKFVLTNRFSSKLLSTKNKFKLIKLSLKYLFKTVEQ